MGQEKIRFALIGCGAIAKKHVLALRRLPEAEIVGVCDLDPGAAAAFGREHGLPAFSRAAEMIDKTDPAILNILTPSGRHAQNVLELMEYRRSFVVEKPLALRLEDADQIVAGCRQYGLAVFVVQQNRFNPPIKKLKETLERGRFGKIVLGSVRVRWCRGQAYYSQRSWRRLSAEGGGVLANQASHHIDMLLWLMGEAESVMAATATRLADIEAEDTAAAVIKFKNGALGLIEATTATRPGDLEGSLSVLGENGSVEIGGFFMNELKHWAFTETSPEDADIRKNHASVPSMTAWNHTEFFRDVIDSWKKKRPGLIDGAEGRKSVALLDALYRSARTGKEVRL